MTLTTPNWQGNSSFSSSIPALQTTIDSTSLGEFKLCPRRYQLGIVEGWRPKGSSPHLDFGIWLHSGVEHYHKARTQGLEHDQAVQQVAKELLVATWDRQLRRPWISGHQIKNRLSLIRSLVWYLDEHQEDNLEIIQLRNGPAVELSGSIQLEICAPDFTRYALSWHIDRLVKLNGQPFVADIKTTSGALGPSYFQSYSPDNQMSLYSMASRIAYAVPTAGVIIDAVQVGVGFTRFERGLVQRTEAQLDEWLQATAHWWIPQMEQAALAMFWPQNDKSCTGPYGDCPFRPVCSRPPGARANWLQADYQRKRWDPAKARGGPEAQ